MTSLLVNEPDHIDKVQDLDNVSQHSKFAPSVNSAFKPTKKTSKQDSIEKGEKSTPGESLPKLKIVVVPEEQVAKFQSNYASQLMNDLQEPISRSPAEGLLLPRGELSTPPH
jgi:hypothetical protein